MKLDGPAVTAIPTASLERDEELYEDVELAVNDQGNYFTVLPTKNGGTILTLVATHEIGLICTEGVEPRPIGTYAIADS
jgi:hypothetical protein